MASYPESWETGQKGPLHVLASLPVSGRAARGSPGLREGPRKPRPLLLATHLRSLAFGASFRAGFLGGSL